MRIAFTFGNRLYCARDAVQLTRLTAREIELFTLRQGAHEESLPGECVLQLLERDLLACECRGEIGGRERARRPTHIAHSGEQRYAATVRHSSSGEITLGLRLGGLVELTSHVVAG